ncbi:MAG: MarR family transcriptional regulator [Alphaproteobacteria bacterium]|nr:MarR family transcriptional regulator [Alphaproteobacteria bacterium]MDE2013704.1 MarR family transcriptional regulator [Alphaproteobacteria bacterium]MDE2073254.1 MarR family transcriptional regulator [Alphaproteobacteria bacterium]MDE2351079.1 MarR family transcriptional regulator [Alphaproteobacteria bacterium]
MTDINIAEPSPHASPLYLRDEELKQGVDLLFSGFSAVFAEGDGLLRAAGLGRAHRRALYFIARNPGLSVAGLLSILRITKQSLARVLNDLIEGGYIERKQAPNDRRMRQLRLTAKGAALDAALWKAQRPLLVRAFRDAGPEAVAGFRRVLMGLAGRRGEDHAP